MVRQRRQTNDNNIGKAYEPYLNPNVQKEFEEFDQISFPPMDFDPPPEKSLKERVLEQLRERVDAIKAHEKRFSSKSYVPDVIFMRRKDRDFGSCQATSVPKTTIFDEDLRSFETISQPDPNLSVVHISQSNFDDLHEPRRRVYWNKTKTEKFKLNSRTLNEEMDDRELPRIPNAEKRFKKLESVKLRLPRLTSEEVRLRSRNPSIVDVFGYLSLLPNTFTKSNKSSLERKRDVLQRYSDLIQNFDYEHRPGTKETEEFIACAKRKKKLEAFLLNSRQVVESRSRQSVPGSSSAAISSHLSTSFQVPGSSNVPIHGTTSLPLLSPFHMQTWSSMPPPALVKKPKDSTLHKRNIDEVSDPAVHILSKKIENGHRLSAVVSREQQEKLEKCLDEARKDKERRREAAQKREEENQRKRKREEEEVQKRLKLQREEDERRHEEMKRQREAEARIQEERYKAAEEERRLKQIEEENRRKAIEGERRRQMEAKKALELEQMRQKIFQGIQSVVPTVRYAERFVAIKCKASKVKSQRRDIFLKKFGWPTDDVELELDRSKAVSDAVLKGTQKMIIIPQENNVNTKSTPLTRPIIRSASKIVLPVKTAPALVRLDLVPADTKLTAAVVNELKVLMAPTRKKVFSRISLYSNEIDYKSIGLDKLKINIIYPFKQSDGMYWPVFYGLRDTRPSSHVVALATCKTFSGKFASRLLLTSSLVEDERKKKLEKTYGDSGGDWSEYSRKPGRFSNRFGFKAHHNRCNDFDLQRREARENMKSQFAHERAEYDNFGRVMDEYSTQRDRKKYKDSMNIHLRELVRDARLDVYSRKETYQDIDDGVIGHPGTRDTPLEIWWYSHGYRIFLNTRDREYGLFMYRACEPYERLLPSRSRRDLFNEWCFAPMLASLYYQARYKPYDTFSSKEMKSQISRYKTYVGMMNDNKFNLKRAIDLCRLTRSDKRQWTILHEQLISHFKDFPAIFQLMFDPKCRMIPRVDQIVQNLMDTTFKNHANSWDYIKVGTREHFRSYRR